MYLKVREDGGVRATSMIAVGINADGYREVFGMTVGNPESESSWSKFVSKLKDRGLHGVDVITSYDHRGLVRAIRQYFQGARGQRCQTPFMKNILDTTPNSLKDEVHSHVQATLETPDEQTARVLLSRTASFCEDTAPKSMNILEGVSMMLQQCFHFLRNIVRNCVLLTA